MSLQDDVIFVEAVFLANVTYQRGLNSKDGLTIYYTPFPPSPPPSDPQTYPLNGHRVSPWEHEQKSGA